MLALIAQSTMPRWLQFGNNAINSGRAAPIKISLKICEEIENEAIVEPKAEPVKPVVKCRSSRIPRMIKPCGKQTAAKGMDQLATAEVKQLKSNRNSASSQQRAGPTRIATWSNGRKAAGVTKATAIEARPTNVKGYSFGGFGMIKQNQQRAEAKAGAGAGAGVGMIAAAAALAPVVRSTRTSRCRIQLTHRDISVKSKILIESKLKEPKQIDQVLEEQSYFKLYTPKSYTVPLLLPKQSITPAVNPFVELLSREHLLSFECSDQKLIQVPCQLINRFSTPICERQKDPLFSYLEPIVLNGVSARTLQRLILWMQHHSKDDIKKLQKMQPAFANVFSQHCTWDEDFLGSDLNEILQLLLAANCLGVYPLVEHASLYFMELIEERNYDERFGSFNSSLSELQSDQDVFN